MIASPTQKASLPYRQAYAGTVCFFMPGQAKEGLCLRRNRGHKADVGGDAHAFDRSEVRVDGGFSVTEHGMHVLHGTLVHRHYGKIVAA